MEIKEWSYEEYPDFSDIPEGAVRLETTGDEVGVLYFHDVPYCERDSKKLVLQILVPYTRNEPDKLYPCFVFVQGSAWRVQNVWSKCGMLARMAARGYVIAIVQYRDSSIAPFPAQIQDAKNAIRFMRMNAAEYHVDADRIVVGGDSSGGHTAVFAALTADGSAEDDSIYPGVSADVKGVVDLYGAVSLVDDDAFPDTAAHHLPQSPEGCLMGGIDMRKDTEVRRIASAECRIKPGMDIVPMLIIHGTKDRTVNPSASAKLYRRLKECGYEAELIFLGGADHGGAEFWTESILEIEDKFIRKCIN